MGDKGFGANLSELQSFASLEQSTGLLQPGGIGSSWANRLGCRNTPRTFLLDLDSIVTFPWMNSTTRNPAGQRRCVDDIHDIMRPLQLLLLRMLYFIPGPGLFWEKSTSNPLGFQLVHGWIRLLHFAVWNRPPLAWVRDMRPINHGAP